MLSILFNNKIIKKLFYRLQRKSLDLYEDEHGNNKWNARIC